jgi:AcrR family transcriptional regulator
MGRKSLKEDRVEQILNAFDECLAEYGLQGVTLELIANRAGMARRMILHYIGRKEDVIAAAALRIAMHFKVAARQFMSISNNENRLEAGLDYLFSEDFYLQPKAQLVAALLPASLYDQKVKIIVHKMYGFFLEELMIELKTRFPDQTDKALRECAYNIVCLAFGSGWMSNINLCPGLTSKRIAYSLLSELKLKPRP